MVEYTVLVPGSAAQLALQRLEVLPPINELVLCQLLYGAVYSVDGGPGAGMAADLAGGHGADQRPAPVHGPRRLFVAYLQVLHDSRRQLLNGGWNGWARMPRSRRQLLNGGWNGCARMPRSRRQLLNGGSECCARMPRSGDSC